MRNKVYRLSWSDGSTSLVLGDVDKRKARSFGNKVMRSYQLYNRRNKIKGHSKRLVKVGQYGIELI